jgi:NAD(P)-dependent dehydrogenase (short-subunit alcohol dehydrogenase family)
MTTDKGAALITGGAKRIGRAIVEALAADGYGVAIHYHHSRAEAGALADSVVRGGGRACAIGFDLGRADVASLVAQAEAALGTLTVLVNNASLFARDEAASFTAASWDTHLAVNARAPALLAQEFARRAPPDRDCCVINLLDQKLWNLNADFFSYTISKMALHGVTALQARALAPVRICGIAPGLTLPSAKMSDDNFRRAHVQTPLNRGSTTQDIVGAVRYIIGACNYTGDVIVIDGGQHLVGRNRDVMFEVAR